MDAYFHAQIKNMVTKNCFAHLANDSNGNSWARETEIILYGDISIKNSNNANPAKEN